MPPDSPPRAEPPTPAPVSTATAVPAQPDVGAPAELGGPAGPEPTRFGDWERKGRCIDF